MTEEKKKPAARHEGHEGRTGVRMLPQISLPPVVSVKHLADAMGISPIDAIKQLMRMGIMANINQTIDYVIAENVAREFGFRTKRLPATQQMIKAKMSEGGKLLPRPPVITIMGHVDHGKTSLLDAIRKSNVVATEAGAITQHIGAYQVEMEGRKITILDTPGHEAFTAMRARGARATDIAVLVVAADDGVQPQTIEAINHAKAAGVPIVVALNKIDKANANPDKVKQQLTDHGLVIEEWGGDIICVPVSAKKREGIGDLLENLLLLADILELKAEVDCPAQGIVVESKMDKNKGPLATLLVQKGTLKVGDFVVIGTIMGKVKAMFNDLGKPMKKIEPATPAEILGISSVVKAGELFAAMTDEKEAKTVIEKRKTEQHETAAGGRALSLSDLSAQIGAGTVKDLNIILKTDVQGSIEPIRDSIERQATEHIKARVIHASSGNITESDVLLALASDAIIVGFNARAEHGAQKMAEMEKISIRYYNVIYDLIDDVSKAVQGMLEPTYEEVVIGNAEIRAVFDAGKSKKIAGIAIKEGKATRDSSIRVLRKNEKVYEGRIGSLRRFKDDVKEVAAGFECGLSIDGFSDYQVGDMLQFVRKERVE